MIPTISPHMCTTEWNLLEDRTYKGKKRDANLTAEHIWQKVCKEGGGRQDLPMRYGAMERG